MQMQELHIKYFQFNATLNKQYLDANFDTLINLNLFIN